MFVKKKQFSRSLLPVPVLSFKIEDPFAKLNPTYGSLVVLWLTIALDHNKEEEFMGHKR